MHVCMCVYVRAREREREERKDERSVGKNGARGYARDATRARRNERTNVRYVGGTTRTELAENKEIEGEETCERETKPMRWNEKERDGARTLPDRTTETVPEEEGKRRKVTREEIPRDKKNREKRIQ